MKAIALEASTFSPETLIDGRYRVAQPLGEGAFGATYLCVDNLTAQKVVIKVAALSPSAIGEGAYERLRQEIFALRKIHHPAIANMLGQGLLSDGRPYLVVEWIDGQSLASMLKQGPLPPPLALLVIHSVTEALAAAHQANIIHRDLKPENIIIPNGVTGSRYRQATLVDFGTMGFLEQSRQEVERTTRPGEFFGTPYYMAPEQIVADPQSPATDLYGLGVLLYEMLYGFPPFKRGEQSIAEFLASALRESVSFPEVPSIPDNLKHFMQDLLAKDPNLRPTSAHAILSRIDQLTLNSILGDEVHTLQPPSALFPPALESASATWPPVSGRVQVQYAAIDEFVLERATPKVRLMNILSATAAALMVLLLLGISYHVRAVWQDYYGVALGIGIALAGIAAGQGTRALIARQRADHVPNVAHLLSDTKQHDTLSKSLAIQVDNLVQYCETTSEKVLGMTIANMVAEFRQAESSSDRQAALMNAAQLLEKLTTRLSPWYIRHDKLIAVSISLIGVITGIVTTVVSSLEALK
jgi:serine/threonine protein kinase